MKNKATKAISTTQDTAGYAVSQLGAYFITLCTYKKVCLFGEVEDGLMKLSSLGDIILSEWKRIPNRFSNVKLDEFGIMPNHIHGILFIIDIALDDCRGEVTTPLHKLTLGQAIAKFKYRTTRRVNIIRQMTGTKLWQRNYYVNVINSKEDLDKIRNYIHDNPIRWNLDRENPKNLK